MREYILQMEQHVTELHKNSVRFIKRLSDMSSSLAEFGASMENLGKFEPDSVAANFKRVAEKTERLAQQGQVRPKASFCSGSVQSIWRRPPPPLSMRRLFEWCWYGNRQSAESLMIKGI